jgi:LacI family transcriptional regulator
MEAVRDKGLRIPQDMSIVGFDDIPQATQVHPPLTTVQQPLEEMGRVATQLLIQRLQDPQASLASVVLPTKLVIRQSSQNVI